MKPHRQSSMLAGFAHNGGVLERAIACVLSALACASTFGQSLGDMTDPKVDVQGKEWTFLAKSTSVIGMPYQPDVTQVTYDGSIFTRSAELCFFTGAKFMPVFARQRTFLEGWLPIVTDSWKDGAIRYEYEVFSQSLPGEGVENTVNFARLSMTNISKKPARGMIASGIRIKRDSSRFGGREFDSKARYRVDKQSEAYLDDKLVCLFPPNRSSNIQVSATLARASDANCISRYERNLAPGETYRLTFKMPRVPVESAQTAFLAKLRASDYAVERAKTVSYWTAAVMGKVVFQIPEPRVQNALRASLVQMLLATRERDGKRFQSDGLPYPDLFLTSNVQAEMAYDLLGRDNEYLNCVSEVLSRQSKEGIFMDTSLPQNSEPLIAAQGQTIHALSYHFVLTHDRSYAKRVFPAIIRGVKWVIQAQKKDRYGLMPPSWPYDNEMILGRYTSHNLWCLLGVRSAIRMASELGELELAKEWMDFEVDYSASIVKALHQSSLSDGSVPPGLYEVKTGNEARSGFKEYQTNQDWENMLLASPTEVLSPDDPLLTATLNRLHRTKFREGVMTYRNGQHLHQYITTNVLEQEMARGDQEQALTDLYHVLLHCGSTHEGFENLVEPWTRQVNLDCPPPHAWASMKTALVIRNSMLVERGGRAGVDEEHRSLHLFSLISPAWVKPGMTLGFRNAPCEMGSVSARLKFNKSGAELVVQGSWRKKPRAIVFHVPYFVKLQSYSLNMLPGQSEHDLEVSVKGQEIWLAPSVQRVHINWTIVRDSERGCLQKLLLAYRREPGFKMVGSEGQVLPAQEAKLSIQESQLPPAKLSFETVLKAFRLEYERRFSIFIKSGGTPLIVGP